ncbi:MAG: ABC transporter ATP-binding protein [Myxococcota bacterium]
MREPVLRLRELRVSFPTPTGRLTAVDGLDLDLFAGETLCMVGESGCGKSVTALSILRLLPEPPAVVAARDILFEGRDLLSLEREEMRQIRGRRISMIFQEPMTSLNPVFTIGNQIAEVLQVHTDLSRAARRARVAELLNLVGIPEPERRMRDYPHQLSGGMRQRVMIAMALACEPAVLIADEPTTALDVTIQAQILDLIAGLQRQLGMSMLLITHDLGVVAETADRVLVVYAGRVVESAPVADLFASPRHPYTRGLLLSMPGGPVPPGTPLQAIPGSVPDMVGAFQGCRFRERCGRASGRCKDDDPVLEPVPGSASHRAACFHLEPPSGEPR